jgi:hypothetical protein
MANRRRTIQRDPLGRVQSEYEEENEENEDAILRPSAGRAENPDSVKLFSDSPRQRQDAATVDAKQAAYLAYDEEMQNVWRGRR